MTRRPRPSLLAIVGPGLLVAATGVGAGDLATAGLVGAELGLGVAWAVLVGAALKLVLTENLARHQLATGSTILESAVARLGWFLYVPFALYLLFWSYFVGAALVAANATTFGALLTPSDPGAHRFLLGAGASAIGLALAWFGGFKLFERIMATCIAVMVVVVCAAAILTRPDLGALARGLVVPTIPTGGVASTVALMGGVGGTLTILCYAYWMRDAGRTSTDDLPTTRLDITFGYAVTALFGVAMIVIASPLDPQGSGSGLIVNLADQLASAFAQQYTPAVGAIARYAFLVGALGAVFSSLLGVWQAVPYVFTDLWNSRALIGRPGAAPAPVSTRSAPYRLFLVALATVPLLSFSVSFAFLQKTYAIVGAAFVPALALVLLILNNRPALVPPAHRNRLLSNSVLVIALVLALALALMDQLL